MTWCRFFLHSLCLSPSLHIRFFFFLLFRLPTFAWVCFVACRYWYATLASHLPDADAELLMPLVLVKYCNVPLKRQFPWLCSFLFAAFCSLLLLLLVMLMVFFCSFPFKSYRFATTYHSNKSFSRWKKEYIYIVCMCATCANIEVKTTQDKNYIHRFLSKTLYNEKKGKWVGANRADMRVYGVHSVCVCVCDTFIGLLSLAKSSSLQFAHHFTRKL